MEKECMISVPAEEIKKLIARGPNGFAQDVKEFCKHLETFRDNIDSLLQEYPMLMVFDANIKITFSIRGDEIASYELGFSDSYMGDADGQRIHDSSAQKKN